MGVYGEEIPKDVDPLPTFITAYPTKGSRLISVAQDEGIEGGVSDGRDLTLADAIAPHWFTPPEGTEMYDCSPCVFVCLHVHIYVAMYLCIVLLRI